MTPSTYRAKIRDRQFTVAPTGAAKPKPRPLTPRKPNDAAKLDAKWDLLLSAAKIQH